jgi:hypothetical protein
MIEKNKENKELIEKRDKEGTKNTNKRRKKADENS